MDTVTVKTLPQLASLLRFNPLKLCATALRKSKNLHVQLASLALRQGRTYTTSKFFLRQIQFFCFLLSNHRYRRLLEWIWACVSGCVELEDTDGFISWTVSCSCSRYTARCKTRNSCWGSAGGADPTADSRTGLSPRGLRPSTSRSSYPSAGDPCHWTRAISASPAYRQGGKNETYMR